MTGNNTLGLQICILNKVMIAPNLFKYLKSVNLIYHFLLFLSASYCIGNKPITTIAFGSCLKETRPQPIWESVVDAKPDIFVLLGDNIYGDTRDMRKLREKWNKFNSIEGFQKLRTNCRLLAVWDDHDYGENDAGLEYPQKAESQQIFLDFLNEPRDSVRRKSPGIYDSIILGPDGKRVQFILLDTRYFRTSLKRALKRKSGNGPYEPDDSEKAELLGTEQWSWLEKTLKIPADLRIIASSIQVLSANHGWETWGNFPNDRARLLNLLMNTKGASIIISGDRHSAEISQFHLPDGFPLLDITSSAMNQRQRPNSEKNTYRIGEKYFNENFGLIEIDWSQKKPSVEVSIRDLQGDSQIKHKFDYNLK